MCINVEGGDVEAQWGLNYNQMLTKQNITLQRQM